MVMENDAPKTETKPEKKPAADAKPREKKQRGPMFVPLCIGAAGFVVFICSAPFWATDDRDAYMTLMANGYKPLKIGGFNPLGCSFDVYATKFYAVNPHGLKVHGNVCKTPHMGPSTIEEDTR